MSSLKYGSPGDPTIGVALAPELEWRIFGKWFDVCKVDIPLQTDRATDLPAASEEVKTKAQKVIHTPHT